MLVVFDLDDTLADTTERTKQFSSPTRGFPHFDADVDWDAYFLTCSSDKPMRETINVLKALDAAGHDVRIWSARGAVARQETIKWLAKHGIPFRVAVKLRLRPESDHRPDLEIKREWAELEKPDLIFDDRDRVVAMWRSLGIRCFQVAPGQY